MQVQEYQGIRYFSDFESERLTIMYDPRSACLPYGLTGDRLSELRLKPWLNVGVNTGGLWGFNQNGYDMVVAFFRDRGDNVDMTFAEAAKNEYPLSILARQGWLREVDYEGEKVYFPNEQLVKRTMKKL